MGHYTLSQTRELDVAFPSPKLYEFWLIGLSSVKEEHGIGY